MNRAPGLLLGLLAAGLLALVAREMDGPEPGSVPRPAASPSRPAPPPAAGPPGPDPVEGWTATLLARPLFTPGRRPPAAAAAAEPPAAAAAEPPRLAGVLAAPDGARAIFAAEGRALVVGEGGAVGPFTVRAIADGVVTLAGPGGVRTLRPRFDDAPAPPPPAGAASQGAAFEALPAPSGLDILRHANRLAPQRADGDPPPPEPGVDQLGGLFAPPSADLMPPQGLSRGPSQASPPAPPGGPAAPVPPSARPGASPTP